MKRMKPVTRNSIFAIITQVISLLYGLTVPRLVLSHYGSELNGLVSSINQFLHYFTLLEAGLASAAVYSLFKPLENKDEQSCVDIVSDCDYEYKKIGFIFVGLSFILSVLFPLFKKAEGISTVECALLILAISITTAISYFIYGRYRALLTAAQHQHILSIASMINMVASTIAVVICINVLNTKIWVMKAVCAVVPLIQLPILLLYTRSKYPWIKKCKPQKLKKIKNRYVAFANEILGTVFTSSPIVILTAFVSFSEVSIYSVYNTIYHGIASLFGSINLAFGSMFGSMIAQDNEKRTAESFSQFESLLYYVSAFIYSSAYVLTIPFIAFYTKGVTDAQYLNSTYAMLFALNGWLNNAYTPQTVMVRAGGLFKESRMQIIIQTIVGVVLGIIFTYKWGTAGLLLALVIANLVRTILAIKVIDFDLGYLNKSNAIIHIIVTGVQIIVSIFIGQFCLHLLGIASVQGETITRWLVQACIVASVSAVTMILFVFFFDRELFTFAKKFVKRKIGK